MADRSASPSAARSIAALAVMLLAGMALWGQLGGRTVPNHPPDAGAPAGQRSPAEKDVRDGVVPPSARPALRTVRDRAVRDEMRQKIFLAWSQGAPPNGASPAPAAPAAPDPLHAPMPTLDGGAVDPEYLRARIREDFLPMAQQCFDQWQTRAADAGGATAGQVVADLVIVGDERVGGVVDEVTLDSEGRDAGPDAAVLGDGEFQTCLRESMMAMAFQPPPGRGSLRVRYPFRFAPDPPADR